jgi:hypothetical protein
MTYQLFYRDNLEVLRTFPDAVVDLVYRHPAFDKNASDNFFLRLRMYVELEVAVYCQVHGAGCPHYNSVFSRAAFVGSHEPAAG